MTPAELLRQAQEGTGLDRFYFDSWRPGLDALVAGYSNTSAFGPGPAAFMDQLVVRALSQRLRVDGWHVQHPEAANAAVTAPVFILGLPRTGTSLLALLLACDPRRRPLRTWEHQDLLPPPRAAHLADDRRIAAQRAAEAEMVRNGFVTPHFELAEDPAECWFLMSHDFKTVGLDHIGDMPAYREWLYGEADMLPAYRHHKRVLQLLQSEAPGRWLLKLPSHALWLEALFAVYPDAHAIVLHRDPVVAAASYCSLTRHARLALHGKADTVQIGAQLFPQFVAHGDRMMAYRDAHPAAPFHDLHYHDLKADPIAQIRRIYDFLGDALSPEVERSMRQVIADRPEQPFGRHDYSLEEFGLEREQVRALFQAYGERYDVRPG